MLHAEKKVAWGRDYDDHDQIMHACILCSITACMIIFLAIDTGSCLHIHEWTYISWCMHAAG